MDEMPDSAFSNNYQPGVASNSNSRLICAVKRGACVISGPQFFKEYHEPQGSYNLPVGSNKRD